MSRRQSKEANYAAMSADEEYDDEAISHGEDAEMQAASSKKRATPTTTSSASKKKRIRTDHKSPINLEGEPHQAVYNFLAQKLGLPYYDAREYIGSTSQYMSELKKRCGEGEFTATIKKEIYYISTSVKNIARQSGQTVNTTTAEEVLARALKNAGNAEFEKELTSLKIKLINAETNHEKIDTLDTFLIDAGFEKLDDYLLTAKDASPKQHHETAIKGIYSELFETAKQQFTNVSAEQLNRFFFLTKPIIQKRNSEMVHERASAYREERRHKELSLARLGREKMGIAPPAHINQSSTKPKRPSPTVQAQQAFMKQIEPHKKGYRFLAQLGYAPYDAEDYLIYLTKKKTGDRRVTPSLITRCIIEDNPHITANKLEKRLEKIMPKLQRLRRNIMSSYGNSSDPFTDAEITSIPSRRLDKKVGDDDLSDIICELEEDTITDNQLEQLGLSTALVKELISEEPANWRKKHLAEYRHVISALFEKVREKFPQASARQLNELHIPLAMQVIAIRTGLQKKASGERSRKRDASAAQYACALFGSKSAALAAVAAPAAAAAVTLEMA